MASGTNSIQQKYNCLWRTIIIVGVLILETSTADDVRRSRDSYSLVRSQTTQVPLCSADEPTEILSGTKMLTTPRVHIS